MLYVFTVFFPRENFHLDKDVLARSMQDCMHRQVPVLCFPSFASLFVLFVCADKIVCFCINDINFSIGFFVSFFSSSLCWIPIPVCMMRRLNTVEHYRPAD